MLQRPPFFKVFFRQKGIRKSRSFLFAVTILAIGYLALGALAISSSLQRKAMLAFHLRIDHFIEWSALQLIPNMYSFHNEYWFGATPQKARDLDNLIATARDENSLLWYGKVNHYPPRISTFTKRKAYYMAPYDLYFQYRSTYQGQQVTSQFRLTKRDNKLIFVDESHRLE